MFFLDDKTLYDFNNDRLQCDSDHTQRNICKGNLRGEVYWFNDEVGGEKSEEFPPCQLTQLKLAEQKNLFAKFFVLVVFLFFLTKPIF